MFYEGLTSQDEGYGGQDHESHDGIGTAPAADIHHHRIQQPQRHQQQPTTRTLLRDPRGEGILWST